VEYLESSAFIFKKFYGSPCVSNPRYDLYVDPGQAALGGFIQDDTVRKLRTLMEMIPTLHRPVSVKILAGTLGLEEGLALEYLRKWATKGLLDLR